MFKTVRKLGVQVVINENVLAGLVAFAAADGALKVFDFSDYFPESASVYYNGSSNAAKKAVETITLAITKLNIKRSNLCIAVCQSLIQATKQIDKTKKCYLITNGVNTQTLTHQTPAENSQKRYMVVMGVIDDWLDFKVPLQVLKQLSVKYPDFGLVVIGPWQKTQFQKQFMQQAQSLGVQSKVTVTGYILKPELDRYLQNATCCLMPYRLDSYFSVIRLPEKFFVYSAYGKPIFSTRLPEVAALKPEHVSFYKNTDQLVNSIESILSNEALAQELSEKGRQFAQHHNFQALAQNLEVILIEHARKR
jgi:glycosyltransferase involved in cell wall biosynthesis